MNSLAKYKQQEMNFKREISTYQPFVALETKVSLMVAFIFTFFDSFLLKESEERGWKTVTKGFFFCVLIPRKRNFQSRCEWIMEADSISNTQFSY